MYEMLSAADRDVICRPLLLERLEPLGFSEIGPRRWIDGSKPPVRRLFELQLRKGASLAACWGFSLDFVPHLSGSSFRWHRSDKTARLDLIVDPIALPHQPTFLYGAQRFEAELVWLLLEAIPAAELDWSRGATYSGMLDIIREIREHESNCLPWINYAQLPLAYMFLAAKVDNRVLAERELEDYLQREGLHPQEADKLRRLVRECGAVEQVVEAPTADL